MILNRIEFYNKEILQKQAIEVEKPLTGLDNRPLRIKEDVSLDHHNKETNTLYYKLKGKLESVKDNFHLDTYMGNICLKGKYGWLERVELSIETRDSATNRSRQITYYITEM